MTERTCRTRKRGEGRRDIIWHGLDEDAKRGMRLNADKFDVLYQQGVTRPKGCRMSIVEAVWKPDEAESSKSVATDGEKAETPSS